MRSFILEVGIFILFCWLLSWGLGSFLRTYETHDLMEVEQFFPALRWQEYYDRKQDVDILILGSSHAYRAYDPEVLGDKMGKENGVYNLGSAAQSPLISYYVLQEALANKKPEKVIVDLYYLVFTDDNQLRNRRYNWEYMRGGMARDDFFKNGFSTEEKVMLTAFPALVYKDYLKPKINKLTGRPHLLEKKGNYQGFGFVSNPDSLTVEALLYANQFDAFQMKTDAMTEENIRYLQKIKDLCQKEQISLVFISSPMPEISVNKIKNYGEFHKIFKQLAADWNISYLDYNINRIENLSDTDHFYDDDHLNAAGARIFSARVAKDIGLTD